MVSLFLLVFLLVFVGQRLRLLLTMLPSMVQTMLPPPPPRRAIPAPASFALIQIWRELGANWARTEREGVGESLRRASSYEGGA